MATFKEICESVLEEANGRPVTLASTNLNTDSDGTYYLTNPTHRNIVRWVNELYEQIQTHMLYADFMHKRGVFLTTVADTDVYTKSKVREIDAWSAYAIKSGTTGRTPVEVAAYEEWLQSERAGDTSSGSPRSLIRKPDDKWIVEPTPSAVWDIYADWWLVPAKFEDACEEPVWADEYHDLLKWKALALFAAEYQAEGAGPILGICAPFVGLSRCFEETEMHLQSALMVVELIKVLFGSLAGTPYFKVAADKILDVAEEAAKDSSTPIDDALVLPICATIRAKYNVPEYGD